MDGDIEIAPLDGCGCCAERAAPDCGPPILRTQGVTGYHQRFGHPPFEEDTDPDGTPIKSLFANYDSVWTSVYTWTDRYTVSGNTYAQDETEAFIRKRHWVGRDGVAPPGTPWYFYAATENTTCPDEWITQTREISLVRPTSSYSLRQEWTRSPGLAPHSCIEEMTLFEETGTVSNPFPSATLISESDENSWTSDVSSATYNRTKNSRSENSSGTYVAESAIVTSHVHTLGNKFVAEDLLETANAAALEAVENEEWVDGGEAWTFVSVADYDPSLPSDTDAVGGLEAYMGSSAHAATVKVMRYRWEMATLSYPNNNYPSEVRLTWEEIFFPDGWDDDEVDEEDRPLPVVTPKAVVWKAPAGVAPDTARFTEDWYTEWSNPVAVPADQKGHVRIHNLRYSCQRGPGAEWIDAESPPPWSPPI